MQRASSLPEERVFENHWEIAGRKAAVDRSDHPIRVEASSARPVRPSAWRREQSSDEVEISSVDFLFKRTGLMKRENCLKMHTLVVEKCREAESLRLGGLLESTETPQVQLDQLGVFEERTVEGPKALAQILPARRAKSSSVVANLNGEVDQGRDYADAP